jgi:hypothetical protein
MLFAQDITGLWKGTLYNDTTQQFYKYEIGISKEKGKLTGFSHTWFILDDKQYYGVKKLKIRIADDEKIIIEDDGLIANNYPVPPSKNVRQLNVLSLDASDSLMTLSGSFSTNRTKEYRPLTGTVKLQRKNDFWQSALVPHLQELGKEKELSFVKEEAEMLAVTQPVSPLNDLEKQKAVQASAIELAEKEALQKKLFQQQAEEKIKTVKELAKQQAADKVRMDKELAEKENAQKLLLKEQAAERARLAKEWAQQAAIKEMLAKQQAEEKRKKEIEIAKLKGLEREKAKNELAQKEANQQRLVKQQAEENARAQKELAMQQAAEKTRLQKEWAQQEAIKVQMAKQKAADEIETEKVLAKQKAAAIARAEEEKAMQEMAKKAKAASGVSERKTIVQQTVQFSSDSLLLSLYDNGEVDGDTVSVLLNGQIILAKQGLSTTAVKKTIYIPSNMDQVELVMYAESLGSIPPNTGLLVIKDGKNLYEVRFSGDLQKNASIVFNRKKE